MTVVPLPAPRELARWLLGQTPDEVQPLVVWDHRATFRCTIGAEQFVCKADNDLVENAREIEGHTLAAAAGIPVPELVAAEPGGLAMRWVAGVALNGGSSAAAWSDAGRIVRRIHDVAPTGVIGGGFLPQSDSWLQTIETQVDEELANCVRDHGLDARQAHRIRDAVTDARSELLAAPLRFCHGDLQPDHVLVDPQTDRVVAVIDWSDYGTGDAGWDLAVLTLDDAPRLPEFLEGYGEALDLVPLYRAVRLLGEVRWLHGHASDAVPAVLAQLAAWRP